MDAGKGQKKKLRTNPSEALRGQISVCEVMSQVFTLATLLCARWQQGCVHVSVIETVGLFVCLVGARDVLKS